MAYKDIAFEGYNRTNPKPLEPHESVISTTVRDAIPLGKRYSGMHNWADDALTEYVLVCSQSLIDNLITSVDSGAISEASALATLNLLWKFNYKQGDTVVVGGNVSQLKNSDGSITVLDVATDGNLSSSNSATNTTVTGLFNFWVKNATNQFKILTSIFYTNLAGGSTNEVLTKNSNTPYDYSFKPLPTTTNPFQSTNLPGTIANFNSELLDPGNFNITWGGPTFNSPTPGISGNGIAVVFKSGSKTVQSIYDTNDDTLGTTIYYRIQNELGAFLNWIVISGNNTGGNTGDENSASILTKLVNQDIVAKSLVVNNNISSVQSKSGSTSAGIFYDTVLDLLSIGGIIKNGTTVVISSASKTNLFSVDIELCNEPTFSTTTQLNTSSSNGSFIANSNYRYIRTKYVSSGGGTYSYTYNFTYPVSQIISNATLSGINLGDETYQSILDKIQTTGIVTSTYYTTFTVNKIVKILNTVTITVKASKVSTASIAAGQIIFTIANTFEPSDLVPITILGTQSSNFASAIAQLDSINRIVLRETLTYSQDIYFTVSYCV